MVDHSHATHTTAYRSVVDDYRLSRISVASQVHKAIRDGDLEHLTDLVSSPELLWEANSSGWTAVHFAASHFIDIFWAEWIYSRAASVQCVSRNPFTNQKNALGQSVFDVFFQSYLDPGQNSRMSVRSRALKASIDRVCKEKKLAQHIRDVLDEKDTCDAASLLQRTLESNPVGCVLDFLLHLGMLCRYSQVRKSEYAVAREWFPQIAAVGGVPQHAARLLLILYPECATELDQDGRLPLHLWVMNKSFCRDQDGMLVPLLETFPQAVSIPDPLSGRLPIHQALLSGIPYLDICTILRYYPSLHHHQNEEEASIVYASLATQPIPVDVRARQRLLSHFGSGVTLWNLMTREGRRAEIDEAREKMECEQLTVLYFILRRSPSVLSHARK